MGDELVRVERFEELATGMRVVAKACVYCGKDDVCVITARSTITPLAWRVWPSCTGNAQVVTDHGVRQGMIFRFPSDLGIADAIAAEQNPYLARTVVGTGGREETRTLTGERGR